MEQENYNNNENPQAESNNTQTIYREPRVEKDDSLIVFVLGIISFVFGVIFGTALPAVILGIIATVKGGRTVRLSLPDIRFAKIGYGLGIAGLVVGGTRLILGITCWAVFMPYVRHMLYMW